MPRACLLCLAALLAGSAARAAEAPDYAKYDCTRTDDGKTVAGDTLAAQGFELIARARFGNATNLMLIEPKSQVRANCFLRAPAAK